MASSLSNQHAAPSLPPWPTASHPTSPLIPAPVAPPVPDRLYRDYAGFWRRFAAAFIDGAIVWTIFFSMRGMLDLVGLDALTNPLFRTDASGVLIFSWGLFSTETALLLLIEILYFGLQERSARQATIGKLALGLMVTDLDGNRITFRRSAERRLARILSIWLFFIGFFIQPFTRKRQALHDVIAHTVVVID